MIVEYYPTNSGGSDWTSASDWADLKEEGWRIGSWRDGQYHSAAKEFDNIEAAISDFEQITAHDARARGCPCCGPPHNFNEIEDYNDYE